MFTRLLIIASILIFSFTQAIADEKVSIKGVSNDSLYSFYEGIAKVIEVIAKRNYEKLNEFGYEEKVILNVSTVISPVNSLSTVKDMKMFREGVVLTSTILSQEDTLGAFKKICLKPAANLTSSDVEKAVNLLMKGPFGNDTETLGIIIISARDSLGKQYSCN